MSPTPRLTPVTTLGDVFGPGLVFNPRVPPLDDCGFLGSSHPRMRDFFTTTFLSIAGSMRLVCSAGGLTSPARALLADAGLPVAERVIPYADEPSYWQALQGCAARGDTMAYQHRHPASAPFQPTPWIDPALLSWLNNKRNLDALVPSEALPRREVVTLADLRRLRPTPRHPVVLKGATEYSSGSGGVVIIARSRDELARAPEKLGRCDAIILEEFLDFERTWCLNYAWDGTRLIDLGAGEQITTPDGTYQGNWFDDRMALPSEAQAIAEAIMRRAIALGYRGFAGFDLGCTSDGRLVALDLNFRLCGSTAALLWWPALAPGLGAHPTARVVTLTSQLPAPATMALATEAREAGVLLPLGCFDSDQTNWQGGPVILRVVLMGTDRHQVETRRQDLAAAGLVS